MQHELKTCLFDIAEAIAEINEYIGTGPKVFAAFRADKRTKRAVERNIEIIGEAMRRALDIEPNLSVSNARKMVDMRNRISHGYDSVSDEILWGVIINHLPILKEEVRLLIDISEMD